MYQKTIVFLKVLKLKENVSFVVVESVLDSALASLVVHLRHEFSGSKFILTSKQALIYIGTVNRQLSNFSIK